MSWGAAIIIILAVGIIWSNVVLLKKTAHMKMPDLLKKQQQDEKTEEQEKQEDSKPSKNEPPNSKP
ncbi:DUF2897 family protein [Aliidiomarina sanyensis]|uniref:DUF2897 domain-containing protein n=1 Tax=Aliidiomarina sanyensis TaxID=1249555 RepID=A0A432WN69_9GAMM|nr:DUF2897 family protein [Aliidiomarina sanyensis]RUO35191.1 hypothetical protein CWE11_03915 [Aliidiomarina sanyensis]